MIVRRVLQTLREEGPGVVARKAVTYLRGCVAARSAIVALRKADRRATTLEQAVDLSFRFEHRGIRIAPFQIRSEIESLLAILAERSPMTILQIGTCTGGTLFLLARASAPDALLLSVDLYQGPFGGGYSRWRAPLYSSFARSRQRIELVLGDSHAPQTLERVRELLRGQLLDFLFIDGDHRYEGISEDFRLYAPLVAPDGLIAFHDIVPGPESAVGGVPRFWQGVKSGADTQELVEDWGQGSAGIGLMSMKARAPRPS